MTDIVVSVTETNPVITTVDNNVSISLSDSTVVVSEATSGPQGIQGIQGVSYTAGDPIYVTVRNATGATLNKGDIVYTSGGNGTHTQVSKALATSDATSARVLGWVAETIANNSSGLCQVEGYIDDINTQGIAEGTQLYLSGTTAGSFQTTKPKAPIHLVYVGVCVKASAGNGRVYVKVQNGYELDEIHDVQITSPTNTQVLAYEDGLWKNKDNTADGVQSIIFTSPLTGGTVTSTGTVGLNSSLLSLTNSQITDFAAGTVTNISGTVTQSQVSGLSTTLNNYAALGSANSFTLGPQTFNTGGTANKGIVVKAILNQGSNLQEWQDSNGNALTRISPTGQFASGANAAIGQTGIDTTTMLRVTSTGTATSGILIKGILNQSANLQEWQDSTGGTVAYMGSGGALRAAVLQSASAAIDARLRNAGGEITFAKATATATGPGVGYARLYFRDGTTAGTLKLVSKAGTAGIEETILDNLNQNGTASAQFVSVGGINTAGSVITSSGLSLSGTAAPILLNGSAGTTGMVLTSNGAGASPSWATASGGGGSFTGGTLSSNLTLVAGSTTVSPLTFQSGTALTSVVAGAREYDGIVFYETPNATTGRALDLAGFYYTNTSLYTMDFASSATAKSLLGSSTAGLTVPAGQTYEYEMFLALQGAWGGTTSTQQGTLAISSSTVSGSPVVAYNHFIEIGSNNTGFTTATTPTITKTTTGRTLTAVTSVNSNQRYFIKLKGILRVTGTGSAKVFPSLAMDVTSPDNAWTISANNIIFKATPIGNDTVTSIGIS